MADWRKVMFCDDSTSRIVLRGYKLVRRPSGVSRYVSRGIPTFAPTDICPAPRHLPLRHLPPDICPPPKKKTTVEV